MQQSLIITISNERISIATTEGFLLSDTPNLVAYDENGSLLIVGETPENVQENSPDKWNHIKSRAHFINPFSIDIFHPAAAAAAINYLIVSVVNLLSEEQQQILLGLTKWQINIVGYEKLDKNTQEAFEYYVQKYSSIHIKSLFINNQSKGISKFRFLETALRNGTLLPIFLGVWLFTQLAQFVNQEKIVLPIFGDNTIILSITGSILILLFIYLSGLMYIAIFKFFLRRLIPAPVYEATIAQEELGLKRLTNWLRRKSSMGTGG